MSLDFTAYFASKPKRLPAACQGDTWILQVEQPMRLERDDVPLGVQALVGRCRWHVELHLEGVATSAAEQALEATVADLVTLSLGVVDQQRNVMINGQGDQPVPTIEEPDDQDAGYALLVYFERANEFTRDDMDRVLQAIEAEMPEALPHRYGLWEPLQHRWDRGGRQAFLELWTRQEPPFWKGRTPVKDTYSSFDYRVADYGFRAGRFEINFRPSLAADPNKLIAALRLGERLAVATEAFYAALISGHKSQGPFWKGIEPVEHLLLVLGEPLLSYWPEFCEFARPLGDGHFAASGLSGTARVKPPERLCYFEADPSERFASMGLQYAADFPFPQSDPYRTPR